MKRDIAERLAATKICDDVTVEQTRAIIREFLTELARCPVCDSSGEFTYRRDVQVQITEARGPAHVTVKAGTPAVCPLCAGSQYDPTYVVWHCKKAETESPCRRDDRCPREGHEECGDHLILPLEEAQS